MNSTTAAKPKPRPAAAQVERDESLKLWIVLARAYGAVAAHVAAEVDRHELTTTEFGILEALYHKGPMILGEIQKKILVTSGGITYLVDRLVTKGLAKRQECPGDRRARYAVLTPAGSALIHGIFPAHAKVITRALSGLTARERADATRLMRKLGLAAAALPAD
jgi:MarR family 2-MHQ and catechol resistance regulon transcriptional repressor